MESETFHFIVSGEPVMTCLLKLGWGGGHNNEHPDWHSKQIAESQTLWIVGMIEDSRARSKVSSPSLTI
jgi:hypothetical protein